jgi:hypothetical protein
LVDRHEARRFILELAGAHKSVKVRLADFDVCTCIDKRRGVEGRRRRREGVEVGVRGGETSKQASKLNNELAPNE